RPGQLDGELPKTPQIAGSRIHQLLHARLWLNGTMSRAPRMRVLVAFTLILLMAGAAMAQRRFFGRQQGREVDVQNQPYDGRFTFVRVKYATAPGGFWYQGLPSWAHGYPMSEDNLMRIMDELSMLGARTDAY